MIAAMNSNMVVNMIDDALLSAYRSLNVSLVNQLLRNTNVTVTLQWTQETVAV